MNIDHLVRQARECSTRAEHSSNPEDQRKLSALAKEWMELALAAANEAREQGEKLS
jgi:hypothetical protein